MAEAEQEIKEAERFYDNLSAAVLVLRDDLKNVPLSHFKLADYEHATPEQFIEDFQKVVDKEPYLQGKAQEPYRDQIHMAGRLLKEANDHLALARKDLEKINRELLELVEKK